MLGVASSTRSLAVGARVIAGRSRVGVIAFQAVADPRMTALGLRLLDTGYHAKKVLTELEGADPHADLRQIGIIDDDGNTVAKTGTGARDWKGHIVTPNMIAMGNVLTSERTISAMIEVLERTADQPLEERLMTALEAGRTPVDRSAVSNPARSKSTIQTTSRTSTCGSTSTRSLSARCAGSSITTRSSSPTTTRAPPIRPSSR